MPPDCAQVGSRTPSRRLWEIHFGTLLNDNGGPRLNDYISYLMFMSFTKGKFFPKSVKVLLSDQIVYEMIEFLTFHSLLGGKWQQIGFEGYPRGY